MIDYSCAEWLLTITLSFSICIDFPAITVCTKCGASCAQSDSHSSEYIGLLLESVGVGID